MLKISFFSVLLVILHYVLSLLWVDFGTKSFLYLTYAVDELDRLFNLGLTKSSDGWAVPSERGVGVIIFMLFAVYFALITIFLKTRKYIRER